MIAADPNAPSSSPVSTAHAALPLNTETLLPLYLSLNLDLHLLSSHTSLPLHTLLAWAETPEIAATAAAWLRHRKLALEAALAGARLTTLPALTQLATTAESPLERRRAASLIFNGNAPGAARRESGVPLLAASSPRSSATECSPPAEGAASPQPDDSRSFDPFADVPLRAPDAAPSAAPPRPPSTNATPRPTPNFPAIHHDPIANVRYPDDGSYFPARDPKPTADGVLNLLRRAIPRTPAAALTTIYPALAHYLKMRSTRDPEQLQSLEHSRILEVIDHPYVLEDPTPIPATEDSPARATVRARFVIPEGAARPFTLHLLHDDHYRKGAPVWRFERITAEEPGADTS